MIREAHPWINARWPNKRGTVCIAFSPTQDQRWSIAIDTFRQTSGDYGFGVFNGKYHQQFLDHGVPFNFERRNKGVGHLIVDRQYILPTIKLRASFDHTVLDLGRSIRSHNGFATEYDIQRSLFNHWEATPFADRFQLVQEEFPVDGGRTSRRIDILAQDRQNGDWLVLELKRAEAKIEVLWQIEAYILALGRKDEFAAGRIMGVLVAERVPEAVRHAAIAAGISVYEIAWPLVLSRVA